ncbi:hypothetical protein [Corynebacterium uterequi]|uniref:Uncharacterized protein n=1 Tax=Corynebacterium uterequi TaxID=1072256 RepID=A0A0G3HKY8_9CORY|nr:hypothetical protein [Corynebacterium uterequi]AKK11772.1 hypothetical protein CUTER_08975 [Corynebacterium uterequi]
MSTSTEITTDAELGKVIRVVEKFLEPVSLTSDGGEGKVFRFGTPGGAYVTVSSDLKIEVDEIESWLDIYEQTEPGAAQRIYQVLAEQLSERVTLFAPDSADVVAEANVS